MSDTSRKILEWFIRNNQELIRMMKETKHSKIGDNPYHLEGDVWTHTLMVYSETLKYDDPVLTFSALLHDIGKVHEKVITYKEKDGIVKKCFYNHEAFSFYMSIDILNKLYETDFDLGMELTFGCRVDVSPSNDYMEYAFGKTKIDILRLVATHSNRELNKFDDDNFCRRYMLLAMCDANGRVTNIPLKQIEQTTELYVRSRDKINTESKHYGRSCYIMVGCPASGKSTLINQSFGSLSVVSRDDLMMSFDSNTEKMTYQEVWRYITNNNLHKEIDRKYNSLENKFINNSNQSFVIDKTNMSKRNRTTLIKRLREKNIEPVIVLMTDVGYEEILHRNDNRDGKNIDKSVIDNMIATFTYPTLEEDYERIIYSNDCIKNK